MIELAGGMTPRLVEAGEQRPDPLARSSSRFTAHATFQSMKERVIGALIATLAIGSAAGCSTSAAEIRTARRAAYMTDFAVVYSEALAATKELYPTLAENASAGVIRTAWHPVRIAAQTAGASTDNPNPQALGNTAGGAVAPINSRRKQFFVRFRVYVVGGKPWRVRLEGQASSWELGEVPVPLKGAEIPPWLEGRTESLRVAIHRRLAAHAVEVEEAAATKAAVRAPPDESEFVDLPEGATKVVAAVAHAAKGRDLESLRANIAGDISWSPGATGADTAIAMWSADSTLLTELSRVLAAGCASSDTEVVCPAAAGIPGYRGFFARFISAAGEWKLISFYRVE